MWHAGVACGHSGPLRTGTSSSDAIFGPSSGQHFKE